MYRKFAIRKLIRELKLRFGFDVPFFDTIEKDYYVNYSEVETVTTGEIEEGLNETNETKTLPSPKKEALTTAKFKVLKKRIEEGTATIEQAENYYEMTNEQKEALKVPEEKDNTKTEQTENLDLDEISKMWGS